MIHLAEEYNSTLFQQTKIIIHLIYELTIDYKDSKYIPHINDENIIPIVENITNNSLDTLELDITYTKITANKPKKMIYTNKILTLDNIKEELYE